MYDNGALTYARAAAISRMVESCTITRNVAAGLDANGMPVASDPVLVYSGPCFLAEKRLVNASASAVAGDFPLDGTFTLKRPSGSAGVTVGDVVVITASSDPDHQWVIGLRLRVTVANPASQKKASECQVQAVLG